MKVAPGTILMKQDTHLPPSVRVSRQVSCGGWIAIKSLDPRGLGMQLKSAGWNFNFVVGSVQKGAFGFNSDTRFERAMSRAIKFAQAEDCNCIEFDQMMEKTIFGVPYTSVSVHSRHIQQALSAKGLPQGNG
jgi:hypothetical protein